MPVIVTLVIAMFLILISWTWHNMGDVENKTKISTIIVALIIVFGITFVLFNISKNVVNYNSEESMSSVRNILVPVFTVINGLIIIPPFAKTIGRVHNKEVSKEQATRHLGFLLIIFAIALVIECSYLTSIQKGILDIYNKAIHKS